MLRLTLTSCSSLLASAAVGCTCCTPGFLTNAAAAAFAAAATTVPALCLLLPEACGNPPLTSALLLLMAADCCGAWGTARSLLAPELDVRCAERCSTAGAGAPPVRSPSPLEWERPRAGAGEGWKRELAPEAGGELAYTACLLSTCVESVLWTVFHAVLRPHGEGGTAIATRKTRLSC